MKLIWHIYLIGADEPWELELVIFDDHGVHGVSLTEGPIPVHYMVPWHRVDHMQGFPQND